MGDDKKQGSLVVGRKEGEAIIIGDSVRVEVLKEESGLIRLKITAPKDISILREEIYEDYKKQA